MKLTTKLKTKAMKTIQINLYSFDELSEAAKQKAIENNLYVNVNYDWYSYIYENAKNIGLEITGFDIDRNRHATGTFITSVCEVAQNIINEHCETCETYKTATKFLEEWQPAFNDYLDETHDDYESKDAEDTMIELEEDFLKSLLEDYSIILQDEYDYLQSDEAIIDTIRANDYLFTQDGKIFNQ